MWPPEQENQRRDNVDNREVKRQALAEVEQEDQRIRFGQARRNQVAQEAIDDLNGLRPQVGEVQMAIVASRAQGLSETALVDARQVEVEIVKTIARVQRNIIIPPGRSARLFQAITNQNYIQNLTPANSIGLYDLIQTAVTRELTVDDLRNHFNRLKSTGYNTFFSTVFPAWAEVLKEAAVDMGMSQGEADEAFRVEEFEGEAARGRGDQTSDILKEKLGPKDEKFFQSLSSPEAFMAYCRDLRRRVEAEMGAPPAGVSEEQWNLRIAEEVSDIIRTRVRSIIYRIYNGVIHRDKDVPFDHAEQEQESMFISPLTLFGNFVEGKLVTLAGKEGEFRDLGEVSEVTRRTLAIPQRELVRGVVNDRGERLPDYERVLPIPELAAGVSDFLTHLADFARAEHKRMSFGYNLEYLIKTAQFKPDEGIMRTIAQYAKSLTNAEIDEIFADKSGELVSRAMLMFELQNEHYFHDLGWKKDPLLVDKFYKNLNNLQDYALKEFKARYGGRFEEWEIYRAVFNAQLMLYGVFFKPFHHFSYTDGYLTEKGAVTVVGGRPLMMGIFEPGTVAKRFQDPNAALWGADWMPFNIDIKKFSWKDWKRWQDAWKLSLERGKAALAYDMDAKGNIRDLAGDEFLRAKLFVDIGNITEAGGLDTLARWRLFYTYLDWIRPNLKTDQTPKFNDPNTLVEMWKRLENIGSDVLENMTIYKFVMSLAPDKGGTLDDPKHPEIHKKENLANLFRFFYRRYFNSSDVGKTFIKKEDGTLFGEDEFVNMITGKMEDKSWYQYEKKVLLSKYLYHVFTVLMFERMPLKFVHLEKQRLTQNGVRLVDELTRRFVGDLDPGSREAKERREQFDTAVNDLLFVQIELRINVSDKMREFAKSRNNLYGDLGNDRSEVNGGRGYVIDERTIEELLRDEFFDAEGRIIPKYREAGFTEDQLRRRIENAKTIHASLKERLANTPDVAAWEVGENAAEGRKASELRKMYMTRAEWFSQLYRGFEFSVLPTSGTTGEFGFSPTSGELAFSFLNYSAVGDETIERLANFCADTAENVTKEWTPLLKLLQAAKEKKSLTEVIKKVWEIREMARQQWGTGDYPDRLAQRFMQRILLYFRKDDPSTMHNGPMDWALNESSSFSEDDTGGPRTGGAVYEFSKNDIDKAVTEATGASGYKMFPSEAKEALIKRTTWGKKHKILGRLLEKIMGRPLEYKIHDWANELSGKALKHFHESHFAKIFKFEVLPRLLVLLLIIMLILGIKSFKSDFTIGGKS